jgi:hypothetical protein
MMVPRITFMPAADAAHDAVVVAQHERRGRIRHNLAG